MKIDQTLSKYITCTIIILLVLCSSALAQGTGADVESWPEGKVVLVTGDTTYGPITYYRSEDVVHVQNANGTVSAYTPVNVQYFVGLQFPGGQAHLFRTLRWNMGRDYSDFKKPTFFEQLNHGGYALLRRQVPVNRDVKRKNNLYSRTGNTEPEHDANLFSYYQAQVQYYVLLPDGEVVTLRNVRRDLERLFGPKSSEVKEYVKERDLDYEMPHRLIAIVNYFNTL